MIKAVIFDMDGLLIDSEPLWFQAQRLVFKKAGIHAATPEDWANMWGRRTDEAVEYIYGRYPWKGHSVKEVAGMIDHEVIDIIKRHVKLKPGVHHTLSVCKKAGLPLAVASSSAVRIIDAVVDTLEIREHFDHIYSAQFEEYGKPHPGVFLKVAKHFKVLPRDCLVFEDSPNGARAAKAAKMICVAVPEPKNRNDKSIRSADVVLGSLEEFDEDVLARLSRG
jgi:mannitol-1-/sugar-/sorbitol-6-/2-deoxyglucose-6-phosphatase